MCKVEDGVYGHSHRNCMSGHCDLECGSDGHDHVNHQEMMVRVKGRGWV